MIRRGFFCLRKYSSFIEVDQSTTLVMNDLSKQLVSEGKKIYRFGFGQSPFPIPESVVNALKVNAHQKDYLPVAGLQALRDEAAKFYNSRQNTKYSGNDVVIGPGSKQLMFLLQLICKADLVLPAPSWVSYEPQSKLLGKQTHWVPTYLKDNWCLDARVLDDELTEIKKKSGSPKNFLLFLNYPNNPTGSVFSELQLKELASVARKHQIIVLADELYGELTFSGKLRSIAEFYEEGTVVSTGLSKWCGAGGWRLGTFYCPPTLQNSLTKSLISVASETHTTAAAPVQYAAVKAYEFGADIQEYLSDVKEIIKIVANYVVRCIREMGITIADPVGGFYVYLDFTSSPDLIAKLKRRNIENCNELAKRLLSDIGLTSLPASDFISAKDRSPPMAIRLAYVDFDGKMALESFRKRKANNTFEESSFLKENCKNIVEGLNALRNWFDE